MLIVVWIVGLLLLLLWSLSMWAAHAAWELLATSSWTEALEDWQQMELPPALEVWLGSAWREWLEALTPVTERLMPAIQQSVQWLGGAMPILLWTVWGLGALALLVLTLLAAGAVGWWRRRRTPAAAT